MRNFARLLLLVILTSCNTGAARAAAPESSGSKSLISMATIRTMAMAGCICALAGYAMHSIATSDTLQENISAITKNEFFKIALESCRYSRYTENPASATAPSLQARIVMKIAEKIYSLIRKQP
jgi:hypothetical protein